MIQFLQQHAGLGWTLAFTIIAIRYGGIVSRTNDVQVDTRGTGSYKRVIAKWDRTTVRFLGFPIFVYRKSV